MPRTPVEDHDQLRILQLVADGLSDQQIADATYVSIRTVKNRLRAVRAALGARNRTHMVAMGYRAGLLGNEAISAEALLRRLGELLGTPLTIHDSGTRR